MIRKLRHLALGSAVASTIAGGCAATTGPGVPVVRAQYEIGVPLAGAPAEPVHGGELAFGVISTGDGLRLGGDFGVRAHVAGGVRGGTFPTLNLLTAYAPGDSGPFLLSATGVGLIGTTSMPKHGYRGYSNTLDFARPKQYLGVGAPLGAGLAASIGASFEILWHVWDERHFGTQYILHLGAGIGFFDPRTPPDENVLCRAFCR